MTTRRGASIGIDVGTTNVKVALVRSDGTLAASASRPLITRRRADAATQDPVALWDAVVAAVGEVCAAAGAEAVQVGRVGVCSQYSSIVPVDASAAPLDELKVYLDHRGTAECLEILSRHPEAFGLWLERHGVPPIGSGLSLGHLLWFQHHRPDVHAVTAAYLEPMDYVTARLCGRLCATQATMFTAQLCDNRRLGVIEYDDDLVALSGVDPDTLPELVLPDAVVGEVQSSLASAWGLRSGVEVVAAMNDSHAGAFATGAWRGDGGGLVVGTTAVLLDHLDHPASDLGSEVVSIPGPLDDTWLVWAENGLAGRAVAHVVDEFVYPNDTLGSHRTGDHFAALEDTLVTVPPGCDGVLFGPWLAGSMAPAASTAMRGAFVNLGLDTTRAHLVRAAVEGTAHNARWLLGAVEALCGRPMSHVVLGGGAARSAAWSQVVADVLDRPVRPLANPEVAVAAAVAQVARVGPRAAADDPDGVVVRTAGELPPDPANRATYDLAQQWFVAAFEALRPIAEGLAAAGDPATDELAAGEDPPPNS